MGRLNESAATSEATDVVAFDASDVLAFAVAPDAEPDEDAQQDQSLHKDFVSWVCGSSESRVSGCCAGGRQIDGGRWDDGARYERYPDIRALFVSGMQGSVAAEQVDFTEAELADALQMASIDRHAQRFALRLMTAERDFDRSIAIIVGPTHINAERQAALARPRDSRHAHWHRKRHAIL